MEKLINKHLLRMKSLQSVYDKNTGQHNVLGILINELTEQLRQHDVVKQSEQLKCPYCGSEEIQIHQDCSTCDECKNMF